VSDSANNQFPEEVRVSLLRQCVVFGAFALSFACTGANSGSSAIAAGTTLPAAPVAAKKPFAVKAPHGAIRQDEYYWLRDDSRKTTEMLEYLKAQNAYADAVMAPLEAFEGTLYNELVGRIKQDDSSVPYRYKDYWYYTRFDARREHSAHHQRARRVGNPKDAKYCDYMLSYPPYDQLAAKSYPSMFVYAGLWDWQVQYWEPAKYVARLRARRTDNNPLVFRTQMEAGHGGRSGRFERLREWAESYAFMLNQLGVRE
jgi:protease II